MQPEGNALQQIKERGYADEYRGMGQPIHLVGMEFSRDSRNVVSFGVGQGLLAGGVSIP
ncbi:MAG TPA: PD-(D/E)XK nuclease domain-containing protein [Candidatus Thiothrix moscowensis]|uniref:PD-(D/E)XK nuclease domain-containing protein n=1 Tax=unclassified Thiothrix TaxID=2636184 RepID=UPI0025E4E8E0|nr:MULTISPECIES: PD-(D/E)XK nuclease domain-containing protein [unclassified Thiothrix]HRJ53965.1 PD-(D/E)XK nuclease domain-containing protein [Candidatus Thiothrix moscowensis]HRJ94047.1 PD-(D/E)XK nuclease domain-containing protein [Candidatus Thiothrix moscowensis]